MIDSDNLRTASLYINNQLLSRGLLRDGRGIDFADPGDHELDVADTMGRIMGVVNDLILRRDRDAEHRESLSTTLRTLRADSLRQSDNFSRLQEKHAEAQRKIALHEAEDAVVRAQLKAAESAVQKLKEEAARARRLVADTRAACANEVRKRDRQIEGLKKAAADAGRTRGERRAPAVTTIHVTGEIGGEGDDVAVVAAGDNPGAGTTASTMDEGYDLRQETNEFLAQLAKGLNEENETLVSLLRKTEDSLKEMSGWDKAQAATSTSSKRDTHTVALVTSPEELAADVDAVLDHLRTMLTNPSFVPLEEVVVREEEIFRLRDGWEKMETRWRETVHLIDGWHRRIAANGRPVDMEELQMGLRLSPVRIRNAGDIAQSSVPFGLPTLQEEDEEDDEEREEEEEGDEEDEEKELGFGGFGQKPGSPSPAESLHLVPAPGYEDTAPEYEDGQNDSDDSDAESSIFHEDVDVDTDMDELQASLPNVEILQQSTSLTDEESPATSTSTSMAPPPPRRHQPLEESNVAGNRKPPSKTTEKSRKRSGEHLAENTNETTEAPPPPPHGTKQGGSPQKRLKVSADSQDEKPPKSRPNSAMLTNSDSSLDSVPVAKPSPEPSVSKASSKTTIKSTRSDVSAKKEIPAQRRPATRATRAAAAATTTATEPKKDTPTRPTTRQRATRATAATTSSSARTTVSKPAEGAGATTSKPRAPPAPTTITTTADMAPPPRPNKSANTSSPNNGKPLVPQPPAPQEDRKIRSPADTQPPPSINIGTSIPAEPELATTNTTSSGSRQPPAPAPDSPTRSPGKSVSRLPLPRNPAPLPQPQQSPLSMARIAAKLAASEREANAARVKAKLRAARLNKTVGGLAPRGSTSTSISSTAPNPAPVATAGLKAPGGGGDGSGDPTKRDRGASGLSSSGAGLTGSGASYSADENGQRGGVSVREEDAAASSVGASSTHAAGDDVVTTGGGSTEQYQKTDEDDNNKNDGDGLGVDDGDNDRKPVVRSPRKVASSPRKASPAKGVVAASPARERPRKRETRSRAEKVANRRRSTLSPWELQSLISGEVVAPSPGRA